MVFHCAFSERSKSSIDFFSVRSAFSSCADFHLFQPAQIAQPHVEDGLGLDVGELERLHQHRLRLILGADDLDDLVEVEIGDEIAAQDFEPMLDLIEPVARAPQQHLAPVRQPFAQRFGKADDFGDAAAHQHVHVERHAAFELGELEQALHQQRRIDAARARLEHEPHVFRGFVAHVGEERQLLLVHQFGDALDQPHLLHLPGDLGDHHLIGAAPGILGLPARAQPERAAPGRVGLGDGLGRIDDDAAGREIGTGHDISAACGCAHSACRSDASAASQSSAILCGGIAVAMPTAMPCAPLARRLGNAAGSTTGSSDTPS